MARRLTRPLLLALMFLTAVVAFGALLHSVDAGGSPAANETGPTYYLDADPYAGDVANHSVVTFENLTADERASFRIATNRTIVADEPPRLAQYADRRHLVERNGTAYRLTLLIRFPTPTPTPANGTGANATGTPPG